MLVKVLGFINTVVMARLLMPEDYGLVALSMLVVGFVQTMIDFGVTTALMRKDELTEDDIDSAWTLRLVQCIVAAAIIAVAPVIVAPVFDEPRITHILWALSGGVAILGLTSMAPDIAVKNFDYFLDFKIAVLCKLMGVVATVALGLWLRDYRALVGGIAVGYILPPLLTYAWHPMRHRFNTTKIHEIWSLTKWLMLANAGGFILKKADELAAAKAGTAAEYGNYNVGADLGSLPVAEIGPATLRALLPVISTIQEDVVRTNQAIVKTLAALGTIIWPIGFGTYALAPMLTFVVLGPKWQSAAVFVGAYGLISVMQTLVMPIKTLLTLRSYTKIQSHLVWIEFFIFCIGALIFSSSHGLIGLVWARLFASLANLVMALYISSKYCALPIFDVITQMFRSMVGSAIMAWMLLKMPQLVHNVYLQFVLSIIYGGVVYVLWTMITWQAMGRPEGFESTLWDRLPGQK